MPWVRNIWEISLPVLAERGYMIMAVNSDTTDYVSCAIALSASIKQFHPSVNICLVTDAADAKYTTWFDHIQLLPYGDVSTNSSWRLSNDWQAFAASPYRETIKLEADMIAAGPIDHWWNLFEKRNVVISTGCRDFYNRTSQSRFYRTLFDANDLPDVYNAITYWRLSTEAKDFFQLVRNIFENWDKYKILLKFPDDEPTTDVVYAIAAKIVGPELVTLPKGLGPSIVHMKKHINPIVSNDWTKELVWEHTIPGLRINTVAQSGLVHYHIKDFIK